MWYEVEWEIIPTVYFVWLVKNSYSFGICKWRIIALGTLYRWYLHGACSPLLLSYLIYFLRMARGPSMDKGLWERHLHACMGTDCRGSAHTAHSSMWLLTWLLLYIRNRGREGDSVVKVTGCSCRGYCLGSCMYMVAHNRLPLQFHETWCLLLSSALPACMCS